MASVASVVGEGHTSATRELVAWPGGYAIYYEDLDDGIEVIHLLTPQPI